MLTVVFRYIKFCFLLKNMLQNIITEKNNLKQWKAAKKMTSEKKKKNKQTQNRPTLINSQGLIYFGSNWLWHKKTSKNRPIALIRIQH